MSRRCRHEHYVFTHQAMVLAGEPFVREIEVRICNDCGAWLSLGPANDGGEHAKTVAMELAAADVAANWDAFNDMRWGDHLPPFVGMGASDMGERYLDVCIPERDAGRLDRVADVRALEIGVLARCIATHEEEQP
jgi:hypothetical protein